MRDHSSMIVLIPGPALSLLTELSLAYFTVHILDSISSAYQYRVTLTFARRENSKESSLLELISSACFLLPKSQVNHSGLDFL
jgi:hypothetical protein